MPLDSTAPEPAARRVVRARLPARLPRHVRDARHGRERPGDRDPGRARSSDHRRHAVHQGRALSRAHVLARPRCCIRCGASAQRAKAASRASPGTRRSTRSPTRFGAIAAPRTAAGDPAVQLCRHDGPAAGRVDGPPLLPPARRVAARPHDLRVGGQGRAGRRSIGASIGMDVEHFDEQQADPDLGQQPDHVEPAFLDARAGSEAPRREADRDRSRTAARPPRSATSTSRCCRAPTRALALGMMHVLIAEDLLDHDYIDRYTIGFERSRSARREWTPERVAATCGIARRAGRPARARLRHDQAGGDPRSTTACSACTGGGNAVRADRLPAGARSARGAIRPAARCFRRPARFPVDYARRSSGPTCSAAQPRTINMSAIGDALDRGADPPMRAHLSSTTQSGGGRAGFGQGRRAGFAREDLFTRRARDLPDRHRRLCRHPAARDDAARARSTSTIPTATSTRSRTTRRSRRWAKRCRTPRSSAASRRAWASTSRASATATRTSRAGVSPRRARAQGFDWDALKQRRLAAARRARGATRRSRKAAFPRRRASASSGQRNAGARRAMIRCPHYIPPRESAGIQPGARAALSAGDSSRRRRAISSTRRSPTCPRFVARSDAASRHASATTRRARGIADGDAGARLQRPRQPSLATARVTDRRARAWWSRLGVVAQVRARWRERERGDSQALTDLGRAATFYDCLVEVMPA